MQLDDVPAARVDGKTLEGDDWVTEKGLEEMARIGSSFSTLFKDTGALAS